MAHFRADEAAASANAEPATVRKMIEERSESNSEHTPTQNKMLTNTLIEFSHELINSKHTIGGNHSKKPTESARERETIRMGLTSAILDNYVFVSIWLAVVIVVAGVVAVIIMRLRVCDEDNTAGMGRTREGENYISMDVRRRYRISGKCALISELTATETYIEYIKQFRFISRRCSCMRWSLSNTRPSTTLCVRRISL